MELAGHAHRRLSFEFDVSALHRAHHRFYTDVLTDVVGPHADVCVAFHGEGDESVICRECHHFSPPTEWNEQGSVMKYISALDSPIPVSNLKPPSARLEIGVEAE